MGLPSGHQTPHKRAPNTNGVPVLYIIPMKQVPQDELKPRSLNEQSSLLLKPAYKYRADFGKCQMREKNVLTNVFVRLWYYM